MGRIRKASSVFSMSEFVATLPSLAVRSLSARSGRLLRRIRGNVLEEFADVQKDVQLGSEYRVLEDTGSHLLFEYSNDVGKKNVIKVRRGTSDLKAFLQVIAKKEYGALEKLVKQFTDPSDIRFVVDAGSNAGFTTIYFSQIFPNAQFICVEPDLGNYETLVANLQLNDLSRAQPFNGGLWGRSTTLVPDRSFRDGAEWAIRLIEAERGGETDGGINVLSLDDLLEKFDFPHIDVLKMDVEGSEFSVFDSAEATANILGKTKFLALEIHEEAGSRSQIESYLSENGFVYFDLHETTFGVNLRHFPGVRSLSR
ncbi:MAG: FkbM family methyltransferase [Pyrinomonadaceae bacterium]